MLSVSKKLESAEEFIKIVEEKINNGLLPAVDIHLDLLGEKHYSCYYRDEDKLTEKACLIGLCITNEEYNSFSELYNNVYVSDWTSDTREKILPKWMKSEQAIALQKLHDEQFAKNLIKKHDFLNKIKEILNV